ncbi:MAG: hypothetical protein CMM24_05610 [Rhodospirillaceae bacterium]|nr:hypothetical protein [Rhodospirillaceae bacterium]
MDLEAFTQEPSFKVKGGEFRFLFPFRGGPATFFKMEFGKFLTDKTQSDAISNQTNLKSLPCRFKPI